MAGMLNIGLTGLNAAQLQLNTTSHNIANAATPGYNRQAVIQTTNDPMFSGAGFFGQGVRVAAVTRQYSQFLENQVLSADNRRSEYAAYGAQISQINNLLADTGVGLSPALQEFFAGVQDVAANPSNMAARQAMISAGQALATRFQTMNGRLDEIRLGTEGEISATVVTINSLAQQIGELNQRIALSQATSGGLPANDLLDQRNVLVSELNKLVRTTTALERDGQLSVFIGSGQSLVLGTNVSRLGTTTDPSDPQRQSIVLIAGSGVEVPMAESIITGGALGGLLAFRRDALDATQERLDLLAVALMDSINARHRLGVDLDNALGQDFFRTNMIQLESGSSAPPRVTIGNDGLLTNGRYRLTYTDANGNFELRSLPDNTLIADPATVGLVISGPATSTAGDSYIIEPLRNAARDFSLAVTDARKVAAGSPVSVSAPLTNAGNAEVSNIVMRSVEAMSPGYPQYPAFRIEYSGGTLTTVPGTYTLTPATFDPATESTGKQFALAIPGSTETFTFTLSGTPQDGDLFEFSATEAGVADNRNMVALGALQTQKTMLDVGSGEATATYQSAYSQLVTLVGNKAREAQVGEQAQQTLVRQAKDARDSLSGVNLDEEAANLVRYQQAYQAAGRVMSIAQRLFDELIAIGR
jgi:flagellar hook-associated protein 1